FKIYAFLFLGYSLLVLINIINKDFIFENIYNPIFYKITFIRFITNLMINYISVLLLFDLFNVIEYNKIKKYLYYYDISKIGVVEYIGENIFLIDENTKSLIKIKDEDIIEKRDNSFLIDLNRIRNYIHIKDREIFEKFILYLDKIKDNFEFEIRFMVDNLERWFLLNGKKESLNKITFYLNDITDVKYIKEYIYESESKFLNIFETIEFLGIILDKNARIKNINEYFLKITGYDRRDVLNLNYFDIFIDKEEREFLEKNFFRNFNKAKFIPKFINKIKKANGEYIEVQWFNYFETDSNDNLVQIISFGKELSSYYNLLNNNIDSGKFEIFTIIFENIHHLFSNYLSLVKSNVEEILLKCAKESSSIENKSKKEEFIDKEHFFKEKIYEINKILEDINLYILILNYFIGKKDFIKKRIDLNNFLYKIINISKTLFPENSTFCYYIDENLSFLYISEEYLFLLLISIFSVCIKNINDKEYFDGEKRIIEFDVTEINVESDVDIISGKLKPANYVVFRIKDNGKILSNELIKKISNYSIFELESKEEILFKELLEIIKLSNGFIHINSNIKKGNEFILFFYAYKSDSNYKDEKTSKDFQNLINDDDLSKIIQKEIKKILFIEDDKILSEVFCKTLLKKGFQIKVVCNYKEAIDVLENEDFDLYLIDLILPDIDGWNLYLKIKELKKDVKIIFMTGYINTRLAREIKEKKIPIIFKPFSVNELIEEIYKNI
ncbi:MAG: response regulator, partial [Spirochaetes bacterium]|nr:response regulator [Spirochaetota bacterium]